MTKAFIAACSFSFVIMFMPVMVIAQTETDLEEAQTTTELRPIRSEDVTAESRAENRQARIDEIKNSLQERLTAAEEQRITSRCSAAQTVVDQLQSRLDTAQESRANAYAEITTKLTNLEAQITEAGVDASSLSDALTQMQTQVDGITASMIDYSTLLSDLSAMECEADAEGFKAVLETARTERADIVTQAQAIRDYLANDVKSILETLRSQLSTASEES